MRYFEVRNNNGIETINDTYMNLSLHCILGGWSGMTVDTNMSSTTNTVTNNLYVTKYPNGKIPGSSYNFFKIPDRYNNEHFVAIPWLNNPGKYWVSCKVSFNGSWGTGERGIFVDVKNYGRYVEEKLGGNIWELHKHLKVFVFSTAIKSNKENFGLECWNEAGVKIFDSEQRYLRIIDSIVLPATDSSVTNFDVPEHRYPVSQISVIPTALKSASRSNTSYTQQIVMTAPNGFKCVTNNYDYGGAAEFPNAGSGQAIIAVADVSALVNLPTTRTIV